MALTYEAIATATASSNTATITFSSISSAYTDLRVVLCGQQSVDTPIYLRYNTDSGNNYWTKNMEAVGTTIYGQRGNPLSGIWTRSEGIDESNLFSSGTWEIASYRAAYYRVCLANRANANNSSTAGLTSTGFGMWKVNNAVTTIELYASSGYWTNGTTATLYGILRA